MAERSPWTVFIPLRTCPVGRDSDRDFSKGTVRPLSGRSASRGAQPVLPPGGRWQKQPPVPTLSMAIPGCATCVGHFPTPGLGCLVPETRSQPPPRHSMESPRPGAEPPFAGGGVRGCAPCLYGCDSLYNSCVKSCIKTQ